MASEKPPILAKSELTLSNLDIIFEERNNLFNHYNLADFDAKLIDNPLFIYRYFTSSIVEESDYKYLPESLLNNPIFLRECLPINPDVYFKLPEALKNVEYFNLIKSHNLRKFLKYDTDANKKDYQYCISALKKEINNIQFCDESLRSDINFIKEALNLDNNRNSINNSKIIIKSIPKKILKDEDFTRQIFELSIASYPSLPLEFRSNFTNATKALFKNSAFIYSIPETLLNDYNFINQFIDMGQIKPSIHFKFNEFFLNIPNIHFTEEFCKRYEIRKCFTPYFKALPSAHRKNINILKTIYCSPENYTSSDIFTRQFLNTISYKDIREGIFAIKENNPSSIVDLSAKFVTSFLLQKELESTITKTDNKPTKFKL